MGGSTTQQQTYKLFMGKRPTDMDVGGMRYAPLSILILCITMVTQFYNLQHSRVKDDGTTPFALASLCYLL